MNRIRLCDRNRLRTTLVAILVLAAAMAGAGERPSVTAAVDTMQAAAGAPLRAVRSRTTGLATFVSAPAGKGIPLPAAPGAPQEEVARLFLATYGAAFGLRQPDELALRRQTPTDAAGIAHTRFQQLHRGIPVAGAELIVHSRGSHVVAVNARTLPDLDDLDPTPAISAAEAAASVRTRLAKHRGSLHPELSEPQLQILGRGLLDGGRYPPRLAWFIEARDLALREFIWIDAQRGFSLLQFSQLADARNRQVYTANNSSSLPGTLKRSEGGGASGDDDADFAYEYAGDTYDFYWGYFGRDSYNDAGATLRSSVHYCPSADYCPYGNAFWNGSQMVYGEDFASADDVVAHELTHAVTEFTANLFYYMQSGALNESFSDIFGETVDLLNGTGNDTAAARWQLSEDLPIGSIRNMMNPNLKGDPGRIGDTRFTCDDPGGDGGGVHSNSGVPNHAFALMADGGIFNGYNITGIGLEDAARIQYRALTEYLVSSSDFLDDYYALQQSCADLAGIGTITAADCDEVKKALDAVQMDDPWPCAPVQPAVPPLCEDWQVVSNLFVDDFENTASGNWTWHDIIGDNSWSYPAYFGPFATSGDEYLWGYDQYTRSDSAIAMTRSILIPSGDVRLQFNHSYGFENYSAFFYDGGVMEYSTDGGATWVDAGSLMTAGAKYGGRIYSGYSNPLANRSAFIRDSYGYTATQLNLQSLAGQSVRFRFRIATDTAADDYGWFIDDLRIYQCQAIPGDSTLACAPTNLAVTCQLGQEVADLALQIWNASGGAMPYSLSTNASWLAVSPVSGVSTGEIDAITVRLATTKLLEGTHTGLITITSSSTNSPKTVSVVVTIQPRTYMSYYVNDAFTNNDAFCTATGHVSNTGMSPNKPKTTVQAILSTYDLDPGDRVYIDTGTYTLPTANIDVTKADAGSAASPVQFIGSPYGVTINRTGTTLSNCVFNLSASHVIVRTAESAARPDTPQRLMRLQGGYAGAYLTGTNDLLESVEACSNLFYGVYLGGTDNRVRNSIVRDSTHVNSSGLYMDGVNAAAEHCTLYANSKYGVRAVRECRLRHNIVVANRAGAYALHEAITNATPDSDYNLVFTTNSAWFGYSGNTNWATLDEWRAVTGQDAHSLFGNPLFVGAATSDFHLRSAAPSGTVNQATGSWTSFPGENSPAIDAADPTAPCTNEPPWNGGVANLGAYGNTPWASRSWDSDADGLSDTYESQRSGTSAAEPDSDGDGLDDGSEVIADTSPTNAESLLQIEALHFTGTAVRVQWAGGSAAFQHLETCEVLDGQPGRWSPVLILRPPTPTSTNYVHAADTNRLRYYRLRASRTDESP